MWREEFLFFTIRVLNVIVLYVGFGCDLIFYLVFIFFVFNWKFFRFNFFEIYFNFEISRGRSREGFVL